MTEESITLENVQVDNQGKLTGKVVDTGGEESRAFLELFQRIQNHFSDEQMVSIIPHNVRRNELCVGKSSKDKKWHRVRAESVLATGQGFQASCFFVDNGTFEMIPLAFLRHIPDTYLQIPFQLKKLYLYGITPITLSISPEDLMTSMQPSCKWDTAAIDYIQKNVKMSHKYNAIVMEQKSDGSLGIRLYLTVGETQFCLNERLISRGYATTVNEDDSEMLMQPPVAAKPKRTIAEVLKSKKISLRQPAQSESEDHNYVSEPELKFGLPQTSSGSEAERGYTTDSSVIPHRHRKLVVAHNPQKRLSSEAMLGDKSAENMLRHSFVDTSNFKGTEINHYENKPGTKKAIFDKLEADLKASSGRSSPLSDVQYQEHFPVRESKRSVKGSQSSLARLQISSTTVTSYKQTGSDSEFSDFSTDAPSNISNFQTLSQVSPHTVPHKSSQTGSSANLDYLKGYQSDTSHIHIKSADSAVKQSSTQYMYSDTENDRLQQYSKYDMSRIHSKRQSPDYAIKQASLSQGIESDSKDLKTASPITSFVKHLSESNSSLSGSGSSVRGRGILSPVRGRAEESPVLGRGRGSPIRGKGVESPAKGREMASPVRAQEFESPGRGRGIVSPVFDQGIKSPGLGRGLGSPVSGRGNTTLYSPTKLHLSCEPDVTSSQSVHDNQHSVYRSESPISVQSFSGKPMSLNIKDVSGSKSVYNTAFHNETGILTSPDSTSISTDKDNFSGSMKTSTVRMSVFDKISNACEKSPVPTRVSNIDTAHSLRQVDDHIISGTYGSVSPVSSSSHVNTREFKTEIQHSRESQGSRNFLNKEHVILTSDSESNYQNPKQFQSGKQIVYSSGTDTDSTNILAKSVTGQQVFTKARLPREATQNVRKSPEKSSRTILPERSPQMSDQEMRGQPKRISSITLDYDSEVTKPLDRLSMSETGDAMEKQDEQKQKFIAKLTGQRMLKNLKEASGRQRTDPKEKQDKQRPKGMFGIEDNVLVHGTQPKRPIYRFSDARFAEIVTQYLIEEDFPSPQIVQAYAWPAIRQGKHVVALAPQRTGKTLAYLCPLITSLTDQRLYKEVGIGNGPYLIILTSSWRKADAVFLETLKLAGGRHDLRPVLLHGGGQEENKGCKLINGCEILVVTPPSLRRVVEAGYTDFLRLCHLVIDDAEEIMENFGEEIKFIMREYTDVIANQSARMEVPRQLLLFGTQWTGRLHSFMNRYPVEPLLIITSAYEASIYGRVKQITHMCKVDDRIREVAGVLENITDENRTIVFATKKEDIINLYKIIRNYSRFCLMVHQDMEMYEISQVAEEWRQHKLHLLVCCDDHISEMHISDASSIINYDLPDSKTKFCNRLACLRKYFWDFSSDQEPSVKPVSHLIITEAIQTSQVYAVLQLLKRSGCPVPQQLKAFMAGAKRGKEEDDMKELCSQLLAFGFCRNQWKCSCRHIVFPDLDHTEESDWLPDEGEVQVFVTHVIDATHYYVRLISVKYGDEKEGHGIVYSQLQIDMGLWYGNLANLTRHKSPYEGEICGFQDRENFYRVQILHFKDMNCRGAANIDVTVKFVDSGRVDDIPAHKLYELPAHIKEVPFQAVEVFVCRVKPIDRDTEWTNKADTFIHGLLHGKIVEGKIVLRLGNILWLDPLVERQNLGETRTIINKAYVHRELITNGFADENPNHLEKLYKLCEDKVKIPKALIKKAKLDCKLETDVLPECKQYHSIVVSSVAGPELFFIQRKEKLDELDDMMEIVNTMMTSQDPVEDVGVEVKVGNFCLAEYTSYDKRWYRGRITKLEEDTCEVYFADYGDRDTVPRDKVRKIPNDDRLTDFPLQSIECRLADIEPRGTELDDKAGDVMWDLTHFVNDDMKTFTAKVKSKDTPDYAGRQKYVVELYDTSGSQDFNLAQELVCQKLCAPVEGGNLNELFPKPSKLRMLIVKTPLEDVPDLCAALYWEKSESAAVKIAGEIKSKLTRVLSSSLIQVEDSVLKKAVASVVKLVGRTEFADVHRLILDTIREITKAGERLGTVILQEDCDQQIVRCLELNSDCEIQCVTIATLAKLVQTSASWKSCFEDLKYVEVLYDLFNSTKTQQIQGHVCKAFTTLCTSPSVFDYIMGKSICSSLTKLLSQCADHDIIETVILFLLSLSHQNSGHPDIVHPDLERESLLQAIILTIKKANSEKCVYHCVQYCSKFAAQKRKHKTVLLELEMVPCLSRLLQEDYSPETIQLCKDLRDSLDIRVPSQKMSGVYMRKDDAPGQSVVQPEIHWAQNSFNVMLSVKVKGVVDSTDLVKIQEDMITFRASVDGVCFTFVYKLFDKVMADHSRIRVKSSEVQISLKKVEKGRWPRLLHQKQKPANLSIDFERFVESSDSEFCDEDEPFMLKRKKKKPFSATDAPKTKARTLQPMDDSETDTTDSLENMPDPDRDRYSLFD